MSENREPITSSSSSNQTKGVAPSLTMMMNQKHEQIQVPTELLDSYSKMDLEERQWWLARERDIEESQVNYIIHLGVILKAVRDRLKNAGARTDVNEHSVTYEKWLKAHNISVSTAYRMVTISEGFFKIKAMNDPEESIMLDNYINHLNQKAQLAIASGNADPEQTNYLLRATAEARNSRVWQEMVKSITHKNEMAKSQSEKIDKLNADNQRLANQLANTQDSRDQIMRKLSDLREDNRHLEMQLAEAKEQTPEVVEVPPADYDELKADKAEAESLLKESEAKLNKITAELSAAKNSGQENRINDLESKAADLKRQVSELTKQNNDLHEKLNHQNSEKEGHLRSYKRVSAAASTMLSILVKSFDVMQLLPDAEKLDEKELSQTDLAKLADEMDSKSSEIRYKLLAKHNVETEHVVEGTFKEVQ